MSARRPDDVAGGGGDPSDRREPAPPAPPTRFEGPTNAAPTVAEGVSGRSFTSSRRPRSHRGLISPTLIQLPAPLAARFTSLGSIGIGGQADVLVCEDRTNGHRVAVKLYRGTQVVLNPSIVDRLKSADPAHVAPVLEVGYDETALWEIQEYFPLGTLWDEIAEVPGPRPELFVRQVVTELTEALDHVHTQNLVHLDLKPANVFVRSLEPVDLVLGDFGLARQLHFSAELMTVAGTFAYMPPEGGYGEASREADWWALGVIAHQFHTGHHLVPDPEDPLALADERLIRKAIAEDSYSLDDVTDERWRLLIDGLLTRPRQHRWGAEQVRQWLAGGAPAVHHEARTPRKRSAASLPFLGGLYDDPAALAAAIRTDFEGARGYLRSEAVRELRRWLRDGPVGQGADQVFSELETKRIPPAAALVELQLILDPASPPVFNSRVVDPEGLARVAEAATSGDVAAQQWIRELRQARIFAVMHRHLADDRLLGTAAEHLRVWSEALDTARRTLDAGTRDLAGSASGLAEGLLLGAALSTASRQELLARARRIDLKGLTVPKDAAAVLGARDAYDVPKAALALTLLPAWVERELRAQRERELAAKEAARRQEEEKREAERRRIQEQRERRGREAAGNRRDARQRIGPRLFGIAILVGMTVSAGITTNPNWGELAVQVALTVAGTVGSLYLVDLVLHRSIGSGSSWLWAGIGYVQGMAWQLMDRWFTGGSLPTGVLPALTMVAGYGVGGAIRAAFLRLPGSRYGRVHQWLALPTVLLPVLFLGLQAARLTPLFGDVELASWYVDAVDQVTRWLPTVQLDADALHALIWWATAAGSVITGNTDHLPRLGSFFANGLLLLASTLTVWAFLAAPMYFFATLYLLGALALVLLVVVVIFYAVLNR